MGNVLKNNTNKLLYMGKRWLTFILCSIEFNNDEMVSCCVLYIKIYVTAPNHHQMQTTLRIWWEKNRMRETEQFFSGGVMWWMGERNNAIFLKNMKTILCNRKKFIFNYRYWNTYSFACFPTSPTRQRSRCHRSIKCRCQLRAQRYMPVIKHTSKAGREIQTDSG